MPTIRTACQLVFLNPSDEGQVRVVSGGSAGTWANIESATFANCVVTPTQIGTTGTYEYSLPSGLSSTTTYTVIVYDTSASAFSDAELETISVGPPPDSASADVSAIVAKVDELAPVKRVDLQIGAIVQRPLSGSRSFSFTIFSRNGAGAFVNVDGGAGSIQVKMKSADYSTSLNSPWSLSGPTLASGQTGTYVCSASIPSTYTDGSFHVQVSAPINSITYLDNASVNVMEANITKDAIQELTDPIQTGVDELTAVDPDHKPTVSAGGLTAIDPTGIDITPEVTQRVVPVMIE